MSENNKQFKERYGRWAIVAGASEGVGASAAEELAARGLDLLLIARSEPRLNASAAEIRSRHTVEVRTLALDLTAPDATQRILAATAGLEVGLLFYNAGAVHNSDLFLDQPIELPLRMIALNCTTPLALSHALAPAMRKRGRGGIVTIGSMACFIGSPHSVAYAAAKAFQVNFIEGLWAELHKDGVDVFSAIIGSTNTPGRSRTLGVAFDPARDMTPEDVVRETLDNLRNGPTRVVANVEWGIGPMAKPWSEFRKTALSTMIEAVNAFLKRQTAPGVRQ
jgi:short-subunit dehydrogenase